MRRMADCALIVRPTSLPVASKADATEEMVLLSTLGMTKAALYDAMREQGVRPGRACAPVALAPAAS